jgi:hypothetical protein
MPAGSILSKSFVAFVAAHASARRLLWYVSLTISQERDSAYETAIVSHPDCLYSLLADHRVYFLLPIGLLLQSRSHSSTCSLY